MLFLLGCPLSQVVAASIAMDLCYMVVDGMIMANCYLLGHDEARRRLREIGGYSLFCPLIVSYYFGSGWVASSLS